VLQTGNDALARLVAAQTAIGSENTMKQLRAATVLSVGSSAAKECVILMPLEA